ELAPRRRRLRGGGRRPGRSRRPGALPGPPCPARPRGGGSRRARRRRRRR
ncbi:MAG: hypothetical protein AVDCRST_MAG13-938, partial [uncultured Solirubrobacteraceae bacterium]